MISLETRLKILKGVLMVNLITQKERRTKDEDIKMYLDAAEKSGEDSLNRDEWDDRWADIARSVGATHF